MEIRGAHVLLTGATRGIGRATAERLASEGARLSLVARSAGALEELARRLGGQAFPTDLADPSALDGLVGRVEAAQGPVDVLVNNAGVDDVGDFLHATAEGTAQVLQVNLASPIELCRQVLPGMVARGRGQVVNVSSGYAHAATIGVAAYCTTKAGLTRFTSALRMDLRGTGVVASVVEPGPITTDMYDRIMATPTGRALRRLQRTGLLFSGRPEQVADAIVEVVRTGRTRRAVPRANGLAAAVAGFPERVAGGVTRSIRVR